MSAYYISGNNTLWSELHQSVYCVNLLHWYIIIVMFFFHLLHNVVIFFQSFKRGQNDSFWPVKSLFSSVIENAVSNYPACLGCVHVCNVFPTLGEISRTHRQRHVRMSPEACLRAAREQQPPGLLHSTSGFHTARRRLLFAENKHAAVGKNTAERFAGAEHTPRASRVRGI